MQVCSLMRRACLSFRRFVRACVPRGVHRACGAPGEGQDVPVALALRDSCVVPSVSFWRVCLPLSSTARSWSCIIYLCQPLSAAKSAPCALRLDLGSRACPPNLANAHVLGINAPRLVSFAPDFAYRAGASWQLCCFERVFLAHVSASGLKSTTMELHDMFVAALVSRENQAPAHQHRALFVSVARRPAAMRRESSETARMQKTGPHAH